MSDRITFAAKIEPDGRRLKGSVQIAGSRTFRNGEWLQIDPKALTKANADNVIATVDHDMSKVMGRTSNGTLSLSRDDQGIEFATAELPNTTAANDALELAKGGYFGGSSFTIEGMRSKFSTDPDGTRVRTITSIKRLADVSLVIDPAFSNSSASAFSKENDMDPEEEQKAPPAPAKEPVASFTEPKAGMDWAEFAKTLTTDQLKNGMDQIMEGAKGNLQGEQIPQYRSFAAEFQSRARADAQLKFEADNLALQHNIIMGRPVKAPGDNEAFASDDYREAFSQYLRSGNPRLMEQFAQSVAGSGAEGGFTVPDGFRTQVTERLVAFGGISGLAETLTTSDGQSIRWPSNDDTANSAAIVAEGVAGTAGADLVFDSITLGAYSYDSNGTGNAPLKVSLELAQDSAFDIGALVSRKLGERIGRKQATDLANGSGSGAPLGLFTKTPDTMTATAASLAAPEHIFQVDAAYRDLGNCRFVMSDTTLVKFWTAQSTTNVPLFIPGETINGRPGGTIYGYPVTIDPAAGDNVAFGDIRRGYIIRRVRGVQVLVDPYTSSSTRQISYHAWARMDANIQDSYAYSVSDYSTVSADT